MFLDGRWLVANDDWRERLEQLLLERATTLKCEANPESLSRLVDVLERDLVGGQSGAGTRTDSLSNGKYRWDHGLIAEHIPHEVSVLDLGCGNGSLLKRLAKEKGARIQGVELDFDLVLDSVTNGVPVFQANLDEGLAGFPDQSFDYVVLEETIQTLNRPKTVLNEMVRVGRLGIVTFPNFGHWQVRIDLALSGRMPVTPSLPFQWFDTPNIRLLTLNDFRAWTNDEGIEIVEGHVYADGSVRPLKDDDNLFADEVMVMIRRTSG
jgi:methionine biosynthesis protein MetW